MNTIPGKIRKILSQGVHFLAREQQSDGSFLGLDSGRQDDFKKARIHRTPFFTSNILHCLNSLPRSAKADKVRQKAVRFLLSQKSQQWSFNYWQRKSQEAGLTPYPDDLDDTFCALTALAGYNSNTINGEVLAHIVKLLANTEIEPGGPYNTWLVDRRAPKVWQDVDLAVNANVAYFLSMQKVRLPKILTFFDQAIKAKKFASLYYSAIPIAYFISRSYQGSYKEKLAEYLVSKRQPDFSWGNPLDTALSVSALINLDCQNPQELEKSIDYLLQNFDGKGWPANAFYLAPEENGKKRFAGTGSVTTAFCLEALVKYLPLLDKPAKQPGNNSRAQDEKIYQSIVNQANTRLSSLPPEVKDYALMALDKTTEKDIDRQIGLLPFWFRESLGDRGKRITDRRVIDLGTANLFGWIAYTIYDDFFDGEGNIDFLPVANIGLREVTACYTGLFGRNNNYSLVNGILNNIDAANAWESKNCSVQIMDGKLSVPKNLPDFKNLQQLADKSLGHALGPLTILMLIGYPAGSIEAKNLKSFFTHYLIARQLNDDAHDWLEDLRAGRINYVGAEVLGIFYKKAVDLKRDEQKLQKLFWNKIIPNIAKKILQHVKSARQSLSRISIIEKPDVLLGLLVKPEAAARQALDESRKMQDFLKNY